ncbi:hypothetical protein FDO65_16620 [Nakamurella flava]|uniref:Alpha/beta hydrolase n=1 Tax=Nakamurella flava TaxID=2576308 RepID=A0A4U6QCI2_9ACTN|nr:hypothetical protein [Nakamurella flava]TKV57763.1 hypothetical protein FDO65_16620 [Nakamurella flava]
MAAALVLALSLPIGAAPVVGASAATPVRAAPVLPAVDPVGVHVVDYDLGDEVVPLAGIPDALGELRGRVYLPAAASTPSPVVVFLHGQHRVCVEDGDSWPCRQGAIPSYLGYADAAEALARQGIAVVSISALAINNADGGSTDYGARARGQLVLDTLDRLAAATSPLGSPGFPAELRGTLDLSRVGLMGHSRGGEGVVRATQLNTQRAHPYPIKAVMPLAAAPFLGLTLPGVTTAVVLGYCDSDNAQQYIDASRDLNDSVLRSTVLVMGANHNFFNAIWSPGGFPVGGVDDIEHLFDDDPVNARVCGPTAPARLTQTQQRAVASAYLLALFRTTLLGDDTLRPMLDGTASGPLPDPFAGTDPAATAALAAADVRVTAQAPAGTRLDLTRFAEGWTRSDSGESTTVPTTGAVRAEGDAQAEICAGTARQAEDRTTFPDLLPGALPACSALDGDQLPHFAPISLAQAVPRTPMAHLSWTSPDAALTVTVRPEAADLTGRGFLDLALAPDDSVAGSTDIALDVVDSDGGVATVDPTRLAPALDVLPGASPQLRKIVLRGVRVPLDSLVGIDLGRVAELRIRPLTAAGGILLGDVSAGDAGVGAPAVPDLPSLDLRPTKVDLTGDRQTVKMALVLDRAVDQTVGVWTQLALSNDQGPGEDRVRWAEIPAGERCVAVGMPVRAGTTGVGLRLTQTLVTGAVPDRVTVDAAFRPAGSTDPVRFGEQGDVCAEALAEPVPLTVTATQDEATDTILRADGFRPGETVTITGLPSSTPTPVADSGGVLSLAVDVGGAPAGSYPVTAVGAGSGRIAQGTVMVDAPDPETTTSVPTTTPPTITTPATSTTTTSTDPTNGSTTTGPSTADPCTTSTTTTVLAMAAGPRDADGENGGRGTPRGWLAATGADLGVPTAVGLLALAAGAALLVRWRRRPDQTGR